MQGAIRLKQTSLLMDTTYAREEIDHNYYPELLIYDKNGKRIGGVGISLYSNGQYSVGFSAFKPQVEDDKIYATLTKLTNGEVKFLLSDSPSASCNGKEIVTAEWVRNLLADLGLTTSS